MVIHLDTTFLVDAMRESRRRSVGPAHRWLAQHRPESLALSVFVLGELLVGAELHAEADQERQRVLSICGELPIISPDRRLAERYASTHAHLSRRGTPLATMDLLIGCTALVEDAAVLTANTGHFSRIPGLRVLEY